MKLLRIIRHVCLCVLLAALPATTRGAGLLVADGGFGGKLELTEHAVDITINNGIAVTEIEQVFLNTESRQVEALYTFPVPKGASVANFSMWIDGKEMIGEVVEKQRAREIYESYKQTRRDPGLLEQVDYKTFEMRIFPINPSAEHRIKLTYYQQLDVDHDWANYVYPLATITRRGIDSRVHGRFACNVRVFSEVPIAEMNSPSHDDDMVVARHSSSFHEASLEQQGGDLARDIVIAYRTSRPQTGIDVITSKPEGEDGYFMLRLTAGEELAALDQAMDFVFILDISGSMANDGKLIVSKDSVRAFIDELGPDDRFEVIAFNVQPETAFNRLRQVDDGAKTDASAFLDTQRARGGTVLGPAIHTAYKYGEPDRPLNVVILSDGMTEQREGAQLLQMIQQGPAHARVFCIGVGNEVNRPLLTQLAEDAGGLAAFVSRDDDFARQAKAFRRKLTRPVATNVEIAIDGVDSYDLEPAKLPNLYHGAPVTLFGRYRGSGTAQVNVTADVQGQALNQAVAVELPKIDGGNTPIERMWAWHRVQNLLRQADRNGTRTPVVDQIVQLGEAYSIATEYTSFIVLENDAEYTRWKIDQRNALRIDRDRRQRANLHQKLQDLRQRAMARLGPVPVNQADKTPQTAQPSQPMPQTARNLNIPMQRPTSTPRSSGGGAIDPVSGLVILGLGGVLLWTHRKASSG